jgi:hypothetical protein
MSLPRLLLLVLAIPAYVCAQVNAGSLSGTVLDPAGAVVPNAKVMLQSEQTGVEQIAASSGAGVYTASKLIENTPGKASSAYGLPQDGKSLSDIRALSVQDIPQKLVATYLYDLPFGKGKRWINDVSSGARKALDAAIGGWAVSGFTIIQSGYPLQITQNDNYTGGMGLGRLRPTLVAGQIRTSANVRDAVGFANQARGAYLNRAAFAVTNRYGVGTVPTVLPNLRQPRFNVTDLAVMKNFRFKERMQVQVRLESQNAFNHPVFNLGASDLNIQSATFGYMNSVISQPRNMQFGARFMF